MANEVTSGVLSAALTEKVINDAFDIARKDRTGLLQVIGMANPFRPYDGHKYSWLDFEVGAVSSTTTATKTAADTTISVADGARFRKGMQISVKNSDEVMYVTAVSGNDLTVVRGYGSTTAASIGNGVEILIDSTSREENSLAENDGIFQPTDRENFFQTMDTAVEFGRRALATMQFGDTNNLTFQVAERMRQLAIQMDKALIRGRRGMQAVDGKNRSTLGGVKYHNDTISGSFKVDHGGVALTLDAINALNESIVAAGGNTDTIAVGIKQARKLSALVRANYSSQRLGDWQADEGSLLTLPSDLPLIGNVNRIVVDTNLNDNELLILDSGALRVVPMASGNGGDAGAWRTMDATQPGQDGERLRVVGDFTLEFRNSRTSCARLHNIAV